MPEPSPIAGRYHLVRPIGRGPRAQVFIARQGAGDALFTLKLIPTGPLRPAEAERILAELDATTGLGHPGILASIEAGYDAPTRQIYLVGPLLHGESFRELLAKTDAPIEPRLDALDATLTPLAAAHARGLVHGDLKPENIFLAATTAGFERAILLDFGTSLALRRASVDQRYRAPEQLAGVPNHRASDVWSFGVMLYEALTGVHPFSGLEDPARVAQEPHRPVRELAPEADLAMAQLVDLCLEKNPAHRPQDAKALSRLYKTLRGGARKLVRDDPGRASLDTVLDSWRDISAPPPPDLEEALVSQPRDPSIHRALYTHYRREGVDDGAYCAAAALEFLGVANEAERATVARHGRSKRFGGDRGLDAAGWAALVHPDQDPRVDAVFNEIVDALAALHHQTDQALGLDAADRVAITPKAGELAKCFGEAIGALRPGVVPRLYRSRAGGPPRHAPSSPPASIFPRGFEEPLPAASLVFAVGRHVAYYRGSHRVAGLLSEPEALERVFQVALQIGLNRAPHQPDHAQLGALLVERMPQSRALALRQVCARLGADSLLADLGAWRRAVELTCERAGLLLSGDLSSSTWMLRWLQERRRLPTADAVDELLAFWSSARHVRLRHQLGKGR